MLGFALVERYKVFCEAWKKMRKNQFILSQEKKDLNFGNSGTNAICFLMLNC